MKRTHSLLMLAALSGVAAIGCGSDRTVIRKETVHQVVAPPPTVERTYETRTTTTTTPSDSIRTTTSTTYPTGRMTIISRENRTFRVGDTTVVYTAPPTVDVTTLEGSDVRVEVAPDGTVSRVTRVQTTY